LYIWNHIVLSFSFWHISLSITRSSFIYVVAKCIHVVIRGWIISHYAYLPHFAYLPIHWWTLRLFSLLNTVTSAAINIEYRHLFNRLMSFP
jgi:hypothetical protein